MGQQPRSGRGVGEIDRLGLGRGVQVEDPGFVGEGRVGGPVQSLDRQHRIGGFQDGLGPLHRRPQLPRQEDEGVGFAAGRDQLRDVRNVQHRRLHRRPGDERATLAPTFDQASLGKRRHRLVGGRPSAAILGREFRLKRQACAGGQSPERILLPPAATPPPLRPPAEFAKVQAGPQFIPGLVDESIRWTTPVRPFMRSAAVDTT
jgi:hypothetical protein